MIDGLLIVVFILGYLAVALENKIAINKTATVLLMAVFSWVLLMIKQYFLVGPDQFVSVTLENLNKHLADIAQLLIFLIGAMTIVAAIDTHNGFKVVTDFIKTREKRKLLWIISFVTFFLSAVLDNLTTSIAMVALTQRFIKDKNDRMIFGSMVIIAANAGGAWTPIGDVTTTMLWIGGRVSTANIMKMLFIPSLVSLLVPLLYFSKTIHGTAANQVDSSLESPMEYGARPVFFLGVGALVFVPIFKAITHLPPFMGMIFCLAVMWIVIDVMQRVREHLKVPKILGTIDFASVLFFLGILLTIGVLETAGILRSFSVWMDTHIRNQDIIVTFLGLISAIAGNVPITAASMGMYNLGACPMDSKIWEMIAFCAGTGGSILIIGSAAGIFVMGMEKITFSWYLRKVSFPAFLGYVAGILSYLLIYFLFH